ncbi:MAG: pilin [Halioglobus sp.]|nr:pilin [Halioglobus sp.]
MQVMQVKTQQGFTLIELMIVIAIVGILAAIALPAYQDYTVRSKMSEPLAALAEAKTSISEYYASQGRWPDDAAQAGINTNPDKPIVASLYYESSGGAVITASIKAGVIPNTTTNKDVGFSLSATTKSDRSIVWICKRTSPVGVTGSIDAKYLPANCRN